MLTPRTRQNCVVVGRPPAAKNEAVTDAWRTSGAVKALELSIWIVYDAAPATSLQSKRDRLLRMGSVGRRQQRRCDGHGRVGGSACCASGRAFVTKASPQKIDRSPFQIVSNAPTVAGKSIEYVRPVT